MYSDHPLASGFSLSDGSVEVEIPSDVASGEDYFIVCESWSSPLKVDCPLLTLALVFGDSGNASPTFTIDDE